MGELGDKLHGAVEPALEPGEELRGVCIATQPSMFKGRRSRSRPPTGGWCSSR